MKLPKCPKPPVSLSLLVLLPLIISCIGEMSAAEPGRLYWNPPLSTPEDLQSKSNSNCPVWSTNAALWNTDEEGKGTQVVWRPGAAAVFSGSGTSTICLDGSVEVSGIEATKGSLDLAGSGLLCVPPEGLTIATGAEITLSSRLQGSAPVVMRGSGTLSLASASASFQGGLKLEGGTLVLLAQGSMGSGTLLVGSNASLVCGSAGLSLSNAVAIASGARLELNIRNTEASFTGGVSGEGEFVKKGAGTLSLSGPLTLTQGLVSQEGGLILSPPSPCSLGVTVSGGLLRVAKGALAKGSRITLSQGGALAASGAFDGPDAWVKSEMIAPDSDGVLALAGETEAVSSPDLSLLADKYPKLSLGACGRTVITGALTHGARKLMLGGGGGLLEVRGPLSGEASLLIGRPGATGRVLLSGTNSFTGGLSVLGGTLMVGNEGALPAGEISLGAPGSSEQTCVLDLNNTTLVNPVRLAGRAGIRNSGGGPAGLRGKVEAGRNLLRLSSDNGSTLVLSGVISSASTIVAGADKMPGPRETPCSNVVELDPAESNSCLRLQAERGVILRAAEGKGLPAEARLVLSGGVYEGSGTMTRELVPDSRSLDGKGGVSLVWDPYGASGFSAHGGDLTVRLGGASLVWGAQPGGQPTPGNYRLVLNAPTADSRLILDMPLDLAGPQLDRKRKVTPLHRIDVGASEVVLTREILDSISSAATNAETNTETIAGTNAETVATTNAVTVAENNGTTNKETISGIEKLGAGTLTLAASNSYNGPTKLSAGTLLLGSPSAIAGTNRCIEPSEGTVLAAGFPVDNAFLKRVVSPNAAPFTVALGCDSALPLDFNSDEGALLRDASLGAIGKCSYSGTLTPCDGVVRLGGGGGDLQVTGSTPAPNVVGGSGTSGRVNLPAGMALPTGFLLASGSLTLGGKAWVPPLLPAEGSSVSAKSSSTSPSSPPLLKAEAPSLKVSAMERWVDAAWSYPADPTGGFEVQFSKKGGAFRTAGKAWPGERFFPLFAGENPSPVEVFVRVAAIDARGGRGPWSNVASVKSAAKRNIEREISERYPDTGDRRHYSAEDPVSTVTYTEEEKESQRAAAREMFDKLKAAAEQSEGPRHFTIPPGIYRLDSGQMKLTNVAGFTIHAPDTEFIIDSENSGALFTFSKCSDVVLTGRPDPSVQPAHPVTNSYLSFDTEHLPMTIGRIIAVNPSANEGTIDLEMLPGYTMDLPDTERMMTYRPDGSLANVEQMGWKSVQKLGGRCLRLTTGSLKNPINQRDVLIPGNLLVLHAGDDKHTNQHVYAASGCTNMTYESIRVLNGAGSPDDHGTAGWTVYRDWRNTPRNGTSRLEIAAGLGQFSKDGGSFLFEDSEWAPHLDDGINLLSTMSVVARQDSADTLILSGPAGPRKGTVLSFYDYITWKKLGEATVTHVSDLKEPETSEAVNAYSHSFGNVENGRNNWKATLDHGVTLTPFAMVVSSDNRADSIIVRGCLFRDQLAQIMLIQGAKSGLIENNLCLRSTGPAVSMQFAQYWWEGPMPGNIIVRNNVIRDNTVSTSVIGADWSGCISAFPGTTRPTSERLLSGFRIEGNTIINAAAQGILLHNVDHAEISHNVIINPGSKALQSDPSRLAAISLASCSDVVVSDNEVIFGNSHCTNAVQIDASCDKATVVAERNVGKAAKAAK
jgi:autotransporter-associated beta strand protein